MTPALWERSGGHQNERINGYLVGRKNLYFGRWLRWEVPRRPTALFRRGRSLPHEARA